MKYRKLGKTNLEVSEISFGGIPVQRVSMAGAISVIKKALDKGINFYDTARVYTDSEEKLGKALADVPRENYILASKSLFPTKDEIKKEIETSLNLLKTDYIDIFQLHNVSSPKKLQIILSEKGALKGLQEAREEGKIRFIGISSHKPEVLNDFLANSDISTVQFPFNVVEPEAVEGILPLAQRYNIGTIVMKPLCGGALTSKKAALQYILKFPFSTVIPGMQTVDEVMENVTASEKSLTDFELNKLQEEASLLGTIFCRRCEYCMPCPQKVNVPFNFLMHGYWKNYGLHEWAENLYHSQKIKASACIQCGECENKCPYSLPIMEMMEKCLKMFEK